MDTFKSRYGDLREFISLNETQIIIKCHNTMFYSISQDENGKVISLDPDGGPNIFLGKILTINNKQYKINKILSSANNDKILNILVDASIF